MQDKHCFGELHCVDRTVGAADVVFDNFQYAGTAEALEYLCCVILTSDNA